MGTRKVRRCLMHAYQKAYLSISNSVFQTISYRTIKGCTFFRFDCNHPPRIHPPITWSTWLGHCCGSLWIVFFFFQWKSNAFEILALFLTDWWIWSTVVAFTNTPSGLLCSLFFSGLMGLIIDGFVQVSIFWISVWCEFTKTSPRAKYVYLVQEPSKRRVERLRRTTMAWDWGRSYLQLDIFELPAMLK